MTALIDRQPGVVEVDEALAELNEERRTFLSGSAEAGQADRAARAAWEENVTAALAAGELPPPKPAPSITDDVHNNMVLSFKAKADRLDERRDRAIVESGDAVRAEALDEATEVLDEAREHVGALKALASRLTAARTAVVEVERSIDKTSGQHRDLPSPAVTPDILLHLSADVDPASLFAEIRQPRRLGMSRIVAEQNDVPEPSEATKNAMRLRDTGYAFGMRRPHGV